MARKRQRTSENGSSSKGSGYEKAMFMSADAAQRYQLLKNKVIVDDRCLDYGLNQYTNSVVYEQIRQQIETRNWANFFDVEEATNISVALEFLVN